MTLPFFRAAAGAVVSLALVQTASADLLITEINSNASGGDFWELTNFGPTAFNLSNYIWDDDSANPQDLAAVTIPSGTVLGANESIIIAVITGSNATFRSTWGLGANVKIVALGGPGLGANDKINLFSPGSVTGATPYLSLGYGVGQFTRPDGSASVGGHAGPSAGAAATALGTSLVWDPRSGTTAATARYTFAVAGVNGAVVSTAADGIGSPAVVPEPSSLLLCGSAVLVGALSRPRRRRA